MNQNTFLNRDAVVAVACAHADGARAEKVAELAERMLHEPVVVPVTRGVDPRFTTRDLIAAEDVIVTHAEEGRGRAAGVLDQRRMIQALDGLGLSEEQRQVVSAITSSGSRVDTIEALAGTGKTTCAGALREVYEQAGYRVLGAAPTARAARELKERADIAESRTLDGWAVKLAADPEALWFAQVAGTHTQRQPAVLIIDEAGMAHTRVSADVIARALAAEVKVVAIGDSGQLSSVQAGGWLGALTRRLGSQELREVMRQRDPGERRALAKVHRGEPHTYLDLKLSRAELRIFAGVEPGVAAEQALIERWARAHERHRGDAVMVCRDNARRERLNVLARAQLRELGDLGQSVEIGGRDWAVGDRVIARRNDRGRDLDNGTRGTVHAVDERNGLIVALNAGGVRQLDVQFIERHVEHAYALTGHGVQGGTVDWAGVIGQPRDFSRNWSYTALSRAREPVEIFLVDEPTALEEERAEIAPAQLGESERGPLQRMAARMRERDDEDLALEQLEHAALTHLDGIERDQLAEPPPAHAGRLDRADRSSGQSWISPGRARVYELDQQLKAIREDLLSSAIADARALQQVDDSIADIEREHMRDAKPHGRRDRLGHEIRKRQREQHLVELREQRTRMIDRTTDPDAVRAQAAELRERQRALVNQHTAAREQAIREEVAQNPPWLQASLGPEPLEDGLRERWCRTAREIAGHRIDHRITQSDEVVGEHIRDSALERAIADTRAVLGLRGPAQESATGLER